MKVFLSHTSEMAKYPEGRTFVEAAMDAVIEAGFTLDEMKFFPASGGSPRELVTERLAPCEIYVGILGFKYGSTVRDQPDVSYTQYELRTAKELGKTLLVFLLDEEAEGLVVSHIGSDNYQGGRLAGESMMEVTGDRDQIVIITYPEVTSCILRVKGFKEYLGERKSKLEIVAELSGKGNRNDGYAFHVIDRRNRMNNFFKNTIARVPVVEYLKKDIMLMEGFYQGSRHEVRKTNEQ